MATRNNSIRRAFKILECFTIHEPEFSASEIARRINMSLPTVHRFLQTLEEIGVVSRCPSNRYQLGLYISELGSRVIYRKVLSDIVQPHVNSIVAKVQETVHVSVFEKNSVVYIARGDSSRSLQIGTYIGKTLPAYCSGAGKVLLSGLEKSALEQYFESVELVRLTSKTITEPEALHRELEQIVERGYSFDNEEAEEGLSCIAVPIYNKGRQIIAAMSISAPTGRLDWARTDHYRQLLEKHAAEITSQFSKIKETE